MKGDSTTRPVLAVADVMALTGFSRPTIIRMFRAEPGVLKLARAEQMHKRPYQTLRIPRYVYERVIRRITV